MQQLFIVDHDSWAAAVQNTACLQSPQTAQLQICYMQQVHTQFEEEHQHALDNRTEQHCKRKSWSTQAPQGKGQEVKCGGGGGGAEGGGCGHTLRGKGLMGVAPKRR